MDTQLIALDPHQMSQAKDHLIEWCDQKLTALQAECEEARQMARALRSGNMGVGRAERLLVGIKKRAMFYTKVRAALAEGYYILPPIPHQTFAIRSARALPPPNEKIGHTWKEDEPGAENLPVGEGDYHNATVVRQVVDTKERHDKEGNAVTVDVWGNVDWKDVEFPFFPVRPEIIEATGEALGKKIFDWLGVAPKYRATDPMIIGCIKHYKQNQGPLHFFVAWWLDTRTL